METKSLARAVALVLVASTMMGNEGCNNKKDQARGLRRRVQMGVIESPQIPLPNGQFFDFKFVANSQLYYVLKTTNSFSSAGIGSTDTYDPSSGLTEQEKQMFYNCQSTEDLVGRSLTKDAACMIKVPQARINGNIESFELEDAIKGFVGLPKFANLGFSAMIKRSRLTMNFTAMDPLIPGLSYAATRPSEKQHEIDVDAKVNFGEFALGLGYYYRSPLANVVNKAMMKGVSDLRAQFDEGEPWWTTVRKNCDNSLLINAGNSADAGLKEGDELAIYNVRYEFQGKACDSRLEYSIREKDPIAIVRVTNVGNVVSEAVFVEYKGDRILPGARAYVHKLLEPPKKTDAK